MSVNNVKVRDVIEVTATPTRKGVYIYYRVGSVGTVTKVDLAGNPWFEHPYFPEEVCVQANTGATFIIIKSN